MSESDDIYKLIAVAILFFLIGFFMPHSQLDVVLLEYRVTHPGYDLDTFNCLNISEGSLTAAKEHGYDGYIEVGCTDENKICHAYPVICRSYDVTNKIYFDADTYDKIYTRRKMNNSYIYKEK